MTARDPSETWEQIVVRLRAAGCTCVSRTGHPGFYDHTFHVLGERTARRQVLCSYCRLSIVFDEPTPVSSWRRVDQARYRRTRTDLKRLERRRLRYLPKRWEMITYGTSIAYARVQRIAAP